MFLIERGKKKVSNGFDLPDGKTIKALKMIKFSSTWECHMQKKMVEYLKEETKKRIYRQLIKVMETKVIGGNLNTALNSWAKVVIRYCGIY